MGCSQAIPVVKIPDVVKRVPSDRVRLTLLASGATDPGKSKKEEDGPLVHLRHIFHGVDAFGDGRVSKVALAAALEDDENTMALVHQAGLLDTFYILNQLFKSGDSDVSFDQFQEHLRKAMLQEAVGERVLQQLEGIFQSFHVDADGSINRLKLLRRLTQDKQHFENLARMVHQAGFNPYIDVLKQLDADGPGRLTWRQFVVCICNSRDASHGEVECQKETLEETQTGSTQRVVAFVMATGDDAERSCWRCCRA